MSQKSFIDRGFTLKNLEINENQKWSVLYLRSSQTNIGMFLNLGIPTWINFLERFRIISGFICRLVGNNISLDDILSGEKKINIIHYTKTC